MTVWAVCPSAAPIPQARLCFEAWRDMGYKVAVAVEDVTRPEAIGADSYVFHVDYPGYARSINVLARHVLERDQLCHVVVAMADDIWPDTKLRADEIADKMFMRFCETCAGRESILIPDWVAVMQPTGDRWVLDGTVPQIDKAAMSPWLSRGWCLRAYQGQGPLWPGYRHCFVDNDLQEVAMKLGVFHQRQDITHLHQHWLRIGNSMPQHARHTTQSWDADKALFAERQAAGFPESELL